MDTLTRGERSARMALVKAHGNKSTELALVQQLRKNGIKGWRRRWRLLGKPDFVFPSLHFAVFVDGCFWHGCRQHCRIPKDNADYWTDKITGNKQRDRTITKLLRQSGWQVLRIWEHDIDNQKGIKRLIKVIKTKHNIESSPLEGLPQAVAHQKV